MRRWARACEVQNRRKSGRKWRTLLAGLLFAELLVLLIKNHGKLPKDQKKQCRQQQTHHFQLSPTLQLGLPHQIQPQPQSQLHAKTQTQATKHPQGSDSKSVNMPETKVQSEIPHGKAQGSSLKGNGHACMRGRIHTSERHSQEAHTNTTDSNKHRHTISPESPMRQYDENRDDDEDDGFRKDGDNRGKGEEVGRSRDMLNEPVGNNAASVRFRTLVKSIAPMLNKENATGKTIETRATSFSRRMPALSALSESNLNAMATQLKIVRTDDGAGTSNGNDSSNKSFGNGRALFFLKADQIDLRLCTLRGLDRVFKRSQHVIDQLRFYQTHGDELPQSLRLNASWTEETGPAQFVVKSTWDYCDQGSVLEYLRIAHGVSVVMRRKGYISFHGPPQLPLALQVSLVEILRQLTLACLEYEAIGALCEDLNPSNILVRADSDRYRFLLTSAKPTYVYHPGFKRFSGFEYVCNAMMDPRSLTSISSYTNRSHDNSNKRNRSDNQTHVQTQVKRAVMTVSYTQTPEIKAIRAQQFQFFKLVWMVLSFTGASDELMDILRDIRLEEADENEENLSKTLVLNCSQARLRLKQSQMQKRLKDSIYDHFKRKGAEVLGALFAELLSFPSPSLDTVRKLANIRKSLLSLFQFSLRKENSK